MAIETLSTQLTRPNQPGLCAWNLERVARAAPGGRDEAAGAVVRAARDLLACDAAVLLRPTERPGVLAATCACGAGDAEHDRWEFDVETAQLFERTSHTADGWREPWSALRMKLRGIDMHSWAAAPLCAEGHTQPLGLLAVGGGADGRPCARLHRLPDFALSASAALSVAPEGDCTSRAPVMPTADQQRLQTIGNLAFGVSHTLGNIFGTIIGNLQFLREEMGSADARGYLDRVERSTADGVELMRRLQEYASIPAEARLRPVDLSEITRKVAALARRLIGHWPSHRRVKIETEVSGQARAWGDERQIGESITNVVFNAIQAVGREGRIVIRCDSDARSSEVRIVDDGPGMTDEVRRRATEPFFTTYPALHQGLGLTVARGVAVAHRGSLTLHQMPVRGTEVALRLPKEPPPQRRPGARGDRGEFSPQTNTVSWC
ncbi:MAG: HAMP domain-containing sensor histidine kinase [Armatimonadota bacterium]